MDTNVSSYVRITKNMFTHKDLVDLNLPFRPPLSDLGSTPQPPPLLYASTPLWGTRSVLCTFSVDEKAVRSQFLPRWLALVELPRPLSGALETCLAMLDPI